VTENAKSVKNWSLNSFKMNKKKAAILLFFIISILILID
jgi:hypothetical protein